MFNFKSNFQATFTVVYFESLPQVYKANLLLLKLLTAWNIFIKFQILIKYIALSNTADINRNLIIKNVKEYKCAML